MKDYAKIVNTTPREPRSTQKTQPQEKPNLVRSAKELQPKENGSSKNTFGVLLVIFILAIVGYGVVRQYFATHHIDFSSGTVTKEVAQSKKNVSSTPAQNTVPQFDFYTVLPKGAQPPAPATTNNTSATNNTAPTATNNPTPTTTPNNTPSANAAPTASTPQATTVAPTTPSAPVSTINVGNSSNGPYYLNAGDYTNNDDAQKMLSQLLLLGAQASVTTKTINGASAYEVLVGPFSDADTMNVVKNQLSSHQINTEVAQ